MIAFPVEQRLPVWLSKPHAFGISLTISPHDRDDAWELCRIVLEYGGVEVSDGRFAFASKDRWMAAIEALRLRFGGDYFETIDLTRLEPY